jgi:hypothetical protein
MRMHTPNILTHTPICNSIDKRLECWPVIEPAWNGPLVVEPIQWQTRSAFRAQAKIGWDQFFRGRIVKAWLASAYQSEWTTRSDSLVHHLHRTSGCEQSSRNFGCSRLSYGSSVTRNCMLALMALSQLWNSSGGKTQRRRLWHITICENYIDQKIRLFFSENNPTF